MTRFSKKYSFFESQSGAGALGGNIVPIWSPKVVSSTNSEMMSEVAYCGYKKNTGKIRVDPVGSSESKCGDTGLIEPPGFGKLIKLRSWRKKNKHERLNERQF